MLAVSQTPHADQENGVKNICLAFAAHFIQKKASGWIASHMLQNQRFQADGTLEIRTFVSTTARKFGVSRQKLWLYHYQ